MNAVARPNRVVVLERLEQIFAEAHLHYHNGDATHAQALWRTLANKRVEFKEAFGLVGLRTAALSGRWVKRIGHFLFLDAYLKLVKLGFIEGVENVCLFVGMYVAGDKTVSNRYMLERYRAHLDIVDTPGLIDDELRAVLHWLRVDYEAVRLNQNKVLDTYEFIALADELWHLAGRKPLVDLDEAAIREGREFLAKHGVGDRWFACLHVRAQGFHGETHGTIRDANIADYVELIKEINRRGGVVVRLGGRHMPPAPPMDGLIDYPYSGDATDRLDIFLAASCRCFIGCTSGLESIPMLFDVPLLMLNWAPLGERPLGENVWYAPKHYRFRDGGRPVSITDLNQRNLQCAERHGRFEDAGIDIHDLSPQELVDAYRYFHDHHLQGTVESPGDITVRELFGNDLASNGVLGRGRAIPHAAVKAYVTNHLTM